MKTDMLIFKPHSIVDIITNSSSELFVCNTEKTVVFIKDFIESFNETTNTRSICKVYQIDENNFSDFVDIKILKQYIQHPNWGDVNNSIGVLCETKNSLQKKIYNNPKRDPDHYLRILAEIEKVEDEWLEANIDDLKKALIGTIIIESGMENSIYFDLMDELEVVFNATRYHLG